MADIDNLIAIYSAIVIVIAGIALVSLFIIPPGYEDTQLYPKEINTSSSLNPYDRGGVPFGTAGATQNSVGVTSTPRTSFTVGTSGNAAARFVSQIARGMRLPASI